MRAGSQTFACVALFACVILANGVRLPIAPLEFDPELPLSYASHSADVVLSDGDVDSLRAAKRREHWDEKLEQLDRDRDQTALFAVIKARDGRSAVSRMIPAVRDGSSLCVTDKDKAQALVRAYAAVSRSSTAGGARMVRLRAAERRRRPARRA